MKLSVLRFCSLAALAAAMTACSSDEPADTVVASAAPQQGITITAKLPVENTFRPRSSGSTVLAQGHNIKRVIYAIYDNSTHELLLSDQMSVTPGTHEFSFTADLPIHVAYLLFVWADAGEYSFSDTAVPYYVDVNAHTITMNTDFLTNPMWTNSDATGMIYRVSKAQPDDMDAFMYYGTMFASGESYPSTVTLTRPLVAMAFFSDCTDSIYDYAKVPYMSSLFSFGGGYAYADSYNYVEDTVTVTTAGKRVNYVDFENNINELYCPWGFGKYKVLAYQYSFAPKNPSHIPFDSGELFLGCKHSATGGYNTYGGQSEVRVDLGEPSTWFKPNTCVALVDDSESNGGKSALISSTTVNATVASGFGSTIQH